MLGYICFVTSIMDGYLLHHLCRPIVEPSNSHFHKKLSLCKYCSYQVTCFIFTYLLLQMYHSFPVYHHVKPSKSYHLVLIPWQNLVTIPTNNDKPCSSPPPTNQASILYHLVFLFFLKTNKMCVTRFCHWTVEMGTLPFPVSLSLLFHN